MTRAALVAGAVMTLSAGCATIPPCPLNGMAAVQCRAGRGDKSAQLELGKAYETGAGVGQDFGRAAELYRAAATSVSGTTYVYSPPVGRSRGQVIPIRTGADQAGLAEAKYRLALLHRAGRGVKLDRARADELFVEAVKQGFRPD